MPETPETHKEVVEIKKEVRDIRQTQDAQIHHDRSKWEAHLKKILSNNFYMMRVLLVVDGMKSGKEIEKGCEIYQVMCWRLLDRLERNGVIFKLEETKRGSPIYMKSRWYRVLRLDEFVQKQLSSQTAQVKLTDEERHVKEQQSQD